MTHRPWYRLHAATWGVGVVVAASLLVLNQHGIEIMLREYYGWPMHFASMGVFRDSSLFEQVKFADGVVPLWRGFRRGAVATFTANFWPST